MRSPSRASIAAPTPTAARGAERVSSGSTHSAPGRVAARSTSPTVDQQHDRAGPRRVVRDGVALEADLAALEAHAGWSDELRAGTRRAGGAGGLSVTVASLISAHALKAMIESAIASTTP